MNTNTKTLFSYFPLVLTLIFSMGFLTSCRVSINEKEENWYTYSLPQGWTNKKDGQIFNEKSEYVGGLNVRAYPRKTEDGVLEFGLADNDSEKISEEVLTGYNYLVYKLVLNQLPPKSDEDDTKAVYEHYLFPVSEHNILIDIYFNTEKTTEAERFGVVNSVKLKLVADKYQSYLAEIWASAWKSRDGKLRYAIMSKDMREDFVKNLETVDNELVWSIRWSSPWVLDYTIEMGEDSATIYYVYTDSTTAKYTSQENITFSMEDGKQVVSSAHNSELTRVANEGEEKKEN